MNFKDFYSTLEKKHYPVFTLEEILAFFPNEKKQNLKMLFSRWKKNKWISSLKRGLYELTFPNEKPLPDLYIGNKLYSPSYVSLETALSYYSLIPEVAMAVTSITTKPTRTFRNRHGLFTYRTIRPEAFTGYIVEKEGPFNVLIAEPEKALIDYWYFKTYEKTRLDFKEERFDKKKLEHLNRKKLRTYAKLFHLRIKELYADL